MPAYERIAAIITLITLATAFSILPEPSDARQTDGDRLEIGGALRYNFYYTDYGGSHDPNDVQYTFDTWRLNVRAVRDGVGLQFEYRFYPTFNTHFVKEGWVDYSFSENHEIQAGVTQVPFGNLQYNSHNWWFQGGYYVGLEDDHDMGIKWIYRKSRSTLMLAYFIQPEPAGPAYGEASFGIGGPGRYSYDIIPITGNKPWDYVLGDGEVSQSNQEKNQFNLRYTYLFGQDEVQTLLGASAQYGQIYNSVTNQNSGRSAFAIHLDGTYGNFNIKAQGSYLNLNATNDQGESVNYVYMGAYGDPYPVASKMMLYTLGIAYSLDVDFGPISNLLFYDNYTYFDKSEERFYDSHQNVLGVLASMGEVFIYFDIASGLNHPWLTDSFGTGLGEGQSDPRLNTRFNINIGYYFN